jgi:hypothetical protein
MEVGDVHAIKTLVAVLDTATDEVVFDNFSVGDGATPAFERAVGAV